MWIATEHRGDAVIDQQYRIRIRRGETEIDLQGDKAFVIEHLEILGKELPKAFEDEEVSRGPVTQKRHMRDRELQKLSLAEFYKERRPETKTQAVVTFAYWLTKREGKNEFKGTDIMSCFDEVRIPKPENVHDILGKLASGSKAHITPSSSKGHWKLTLTGEEFVENQLSEKKEG